VRPLTRAKRRELQREEDVRRVLALMEADRQRMFDRAKPKPKPKPKARPFVWDGVS
jgi:type II secretory pathway component PulJ